MLCYVLNSAKTQLFIDSLFVSDIRGRPMRQFIEDNKDNKATYGILNLSNLSYTAILK